MIVGAGSFQNVPPVVPSVRTRPRRRPLFSVKMNAGSVDSRQSRSRYLSGESPRSSRSREPQPCTSGTSRASPADTPATDPARICHRPHAGQAHLHEPLMSASADAPPVAVPCANRLLTGLRHTEPSAQHPTHVRYPTCADGERFTPDRFNVGNLLARDPPWSQREPNATAGRTSCPALRH